MNQTEICKSKMQFRKRSLTAYHALTYGNYPYQCEICKKWHLSSKDPKKAQEFARVVLIKTLREFTRIKQGKKTKHRRVFRIRGEI